MVMVGASGVQIERSVGTKIPKEITVVTVISASPFTNRFRQFFEEGVQRFVPQIEREDRVALVDRVQSSAAWNFDFISLMVLSTVMAAAGLIQNSAAVVIGAMLVAPLMTPLLGIGLALVQGNPVLALLSLQSVTRGICVSLLGGFLVGLFTLSFDEPTREMLARGGLVCRSLCGVRGWIGCGLRILQAGTYCGPSRCSNCCGIGTADCPDLGAGSFDRRFLLGSRCPAAVRHQYGHHHTGIHDQSLACRFAQPQKDFSLDENFVLWRRCLSLSNGLGALPGYPFGGV